MKNRFRSCIFMVALFMLSCGGAAPPAEVAPPPEVATPSSSGAVADAPVLAVALEGDVLALSETEYRAKGPEIRCSAFLIENGAALPIVGLAEWRALPDGAGVFSTGATGVFFIPERSGKIEIEAECGHGGQRLKSPRLVLHVAESR